MNNKQIAYKDLNKHFTTPKIISPAYPANIHIPRKLKKQIKSFCGVHWSGLDNASRLWYYLEKSNPNYKRFLISQIV